MGRRDDYEVRRSARARRVRVTVDPDGGVVVTLPRRAPARAAAEAVTELAPWIERRRRALAGAAAAVAGPAGTLPYPGGLLTPVPQPGPTPPHRRRDPPLGPPHPPRAAAERLDRPPAP